MASEKSSTPRSRIASCQRGSSTTTCSQAMNSSDVIGGCTPATARTDSTVCRVSETTAS